MNAEQLIFVVASSARSCETLCANLWNRAPLSAPLELDADKCQALAAAARLLSAAAEALQRQAAGVPPQLENFRASCLSEGERRETAKQSEPK